jgi:hypothetical protein
MPLILPGNVATATASTTYEVANSCRFEDGDSAYMRITPGSAATSSRKMTASFWCKRGNLGITGRIFNADTGSNQRDSLFFNSDDNLWLYINNGGDGNLKTTRVFRDPAAWYHVVLTIDTTQSTNTNRVKLYINGTQETSFQTGGDGIVYPDQNYDIIGFGQNGKEQTIGADTSGGNSDNEWDGYLTEFVFIDGLALAPTSFGEYNEDSPTIWQPKAVSGLTFGTNGFYLDFEDSGDLGDDESGNGNDFTETNLAATDQSTDTCTNNFATWNPLFRKGTTTPAFAEGNLKSTFDDGGANEFALTTFGVSAGKWYAEVKWPSNTGTGATATGILDMAYTGTDDPNNAVTNAFGYFGSGTKNVSGTASSYGNSYADGDIIGIAIDMDNNKLYFSKNGTFQDSGDPASGSTGTGAISIVSGVTYGIFASDYNSQVAELNTGSPPFSISSGNADDNGYGNFEYAPPSGYLALCTKNLGSDGG